MGTVTFKLHYPFNAWLNSEYGSSSVQVDIASEESFKSLLNKLVVSNAPMISQFYDATDGSLKFGVLLLLNNSALYTQDEFEVKLKDGDIIQVVPLFGGG